MPRPSRATTALALLACGLLSFSSGNTTWAPAAWLGPLLLLRLLRNDPSRARLLLGYGVYLIGLGSAWAPSLGPLGGPLIFLGAPLVAVLAFLPYVADRLLARPGGSFGSTLSFPLAWVSAELLLSLPLRGNLTTPALSHTEILPLLQLVSLGGAFALSFLVAWFASAANWVWEQRGERARAGGGAAVYLSVLGLALGWGTLRLSLHSPEPALPVAAVRLANRRPHPDDGIKLLEHTRSALEAGARAVVWAEVSLRLPVGDLPALKAQAAQLARAHRATLLLALGVEHPGETRLDNRVWVVGPEGQELTSYRKSFLAPGERSIPGKGVLPCVTTPHGRWSTAICADLSDPRLLRQAGRDGIDLLFAPAAEWPGIDPTNSRVALLRAVENGFTLVKAARGGRSLVADPLGRVLGELRAEDPTSSLLVVAPTQDVPTLYARLGDTFAWSCLLALLAVIAQALIRRRGWRQTPAS